MEYFHVYTISVNSHPLPSTNEVSNVTLAAFLRPAGRLRPILSSFSRRRFPPSFDFALYVNTNIKFGFCRQNILDEEHDS